ncbi:DEAD/DEAH box helicase [Maliponia aquimaris]|uniref:DEAD/DEAH box helicase n=1 Tax=Maliponia aquimaris TaxID=1673631 RepID=UPI000B8B11A6|nr:DEAD/DEAH box helicase [Maliponia aquimaris]
MKQALRDALDDRGYTTLTPVQEAVLAPELEGRDMLVSAQTGSGKTLGFGLAIAPVLLGEGESFETAGAPLALVIAPTRELALQVKRELSWLYARAGAVLASCVGGMDMRDERRALGRGAHVVVATPGRLRDHIMRQSIDLSQLRAVVLDEADEMLDLGFREDLEFILGESPTERQTLLFSATVPDAIAKLAKSYQRNAERVVAKSDSVQHADIAYRAMMVADSDAENAVINTLRYYEAPNALVFGNTRAMVNRLTTRLSNRGFHVVALSGELSQAERSHALQAMRDGRARVCVATDVAARGIDLPNLELVVHAELPSNHETLLHRSGRTGRAGRKGVSALIVTRKSRKKAERILNWAKVQADWGDAPSADEVRARDEDRLFAAPEWQEPVPESDEELAGKLVAAFTPEQLAAAFLRMYQSVRSAPEELSDLDSSAPTPRQEFGASVWFSIEGGRVAGAEPRRILPMICNAGNLTKDDIGAIRIREDKSLVQIRESSVPVFLAGLGAEMVLPEGQKVTQLAEAPAFTRNDRPVGSKPPGKGPRAARPADVKPPRPPKGDRPERPAAKRARPVQEDAPGDAAPAAPAAAPVAESHPAPSVSEAPAAAPRAPEERPAEQPKERPAKPRATGAKPYAKDGEKPARPASKRPRADGEAWSGSKPARRGAEDRPAAGAKRPRPAKDYANAADTSARFVPPKKRRAPDGEAGTEPPRRPREDRPKDRPFKSADRPKGPPPPPGKPSSKKNKARADAKKPGGFAGKPPRKKP